MCQLYTATNCVTMPIQHNTCSVRYAVFMVLSPWRLHRSRQFLSDSVSRKVSSESFSLSYQQGTVLCKRSSSVLPYKCRYRNQSLQHDVQRKRHYSLPSNIYSDSSNKRSCVLTLSCIEYSSQIHQCSSLSHFPLQKHLSLQWIGWTNHSILHFYTIKSHCTSLLSIQL